MPQPPNEAVAPASSTEPEAPRAGTPPGFGPRQRPAREGTKYDADIERWRTGIKLVNFSTDADASVEMRLAGEVQYEYTVENGTRYLKFLPRVRAVDMKLVEFDLRRISLAAGPLVQDLGDMVTNPLADQLDKHEPKIVEKLNKSIVKRQDRLKIPVSLPFDWSDWSWSKS